MNIFSVSPNSLYQSRPHIDLPLSCHRLIQLLEKIRIETSNYKVGVLNYILNSDSDYNFDFICLLDAFSSNLIIESFKKRNIDVLIYGTIKPNQNLTYIIDDYKIV